jgi:FkbM family methyltransferase
MKKILRANSSARAFRENYLGLRNTRDSAVKRFAKICNSMEVLTVFDVGANVGQFSKDIRRHSFKAKIYSFEPVQETFIKLVSNFRNDSEWRGIKKGVGRYTGTLEINLSANAGLSTSFMEMGEQHLIDFPDSRYIGTETVEVTTIDAQISDLKIQPSKLAVKIDVQGFELEVLWGMTTYIRDIRCLLIEASLVPLYLGEPTLSEIIAFLESHNHRVVDVFRGVQSRTGQLLQVDLISVNLKDL